MSRKAAQIVEDKARAYRQTFGSPSGQQVLADLQAFCRATEGPYAPGDANETFMRIGCLEVWNHISRHLQLAPEQLFALYMGRMIKVEKEGDDR